MSTAAVWDHIRHGRAPTPTRVSQVAGSRLSGPEDVGARGRLVGALLGCGPLDALVEDPDVTDVLVNGTRGVWVDRGDGLAQVDLDLGGDADLRRLAVRLAGSAGRRLDDSCPFVDGLLPGGVRLHALLPPLVADGPHISLRVPRRSSPRLADLVAWGTCSPEIAEVLSALVGHRVAYLLSGGTGSGKTTMLAALLAAVPHVERLVVVEDVAELSVDHPHVVSLQTRHANVEGHGAVDLTTLFRQSLRMRPDRIAVGEVRGAEIRDMLTALNTGHEGGCATVHANAPGDVVARVEALGALAGMTPSAARSQLVSAIRVVVHMRRDGRARVVDSIGVLEGDPSAVRVLPAWRRVGTALVPDVGAGRLDALIGATPGETG